MNMRDISQRVADKHGLTLTDIRGPARDRYIVLPRQEAMWELSRVKDEEGGKRYSLTQIGNFLGHRDHTTVLWGARRHEARLVNGCIKSVLSVSREEAA